MLQTLQRRSPGRLSERTNEDDAYAQPLVLYVSSKFPGSISYLTRALQVATVRTLQRLMLFKTLWEPVIVQLLT